MSFVDLFCLLKKRLENKLIFILCSIFRLAFVSFNKVRNLECALFLHNHCTLSFERDFQKKDNKSTIKVEISCNIEIITSNT